MGSFSKGPSYTSVKVKLQHSLLDHLPGNWTSEDWFDQVHVSCSQKCVQMPHPEVLVNFLEKKKVSNHDFLLIDQVLKPNYVDLFLLSYFLTKVNSLRLNTSMFKFKFLSTQQGIRFKCPTLPWHRLQEFGCFPEGSGVGSGNVEASNWSAD